MKTLIKFLLLISLGLGSTTYAASGSVDESMDKESKIMTRLRQEVADLEVKFNLDFFDIDLFQGISLSSRYRYEVEPSYEAEYFSRIDKWRLNANISVGDIIENSSPVYFNIKRDSEVIFVRQFKSKKDALKAVPYSFNKLPVKADVVDKLEPGDFVSLPANLTVAFGATTNFGPAKIPGTAGLYYVAHGQFLVHIFKMKDNKVRLKIIAERGSSRGAGGKIEADVEFAGISIVDKAIERVFDLEFLDVGTSKGTGHQLIIDYVFDMNDQDARDAYDRVLNSSFKFKDVSIFSKNITHGNMENSLVSTFEKAEELASNDLEKETKRVERLFKGFNDFSFKRNRIKLSVILANFKKDNRYTQNNITFEDDHGQRDHFYYPTYTRNKQAKLRTWPFDFKEETETQLFGLAPTKSDGESDFYSDFGLNYYRKDKSFNAEEQAKVHQILMDNLPISLYENINWEEWKEFDRKRNVRIFFQVIFKGNAFEEIKDMSADEVETKILAYLKERNRLYTGKLSGIFGGIWRRITNAFNINKREARKLSRKLHAIISNQDLKGAAKIKALMELRDEPIFRQIGVGFLASLLDQSDLEDKVYYEIKLVATDVEPLELRYGQRAYSELYEQLLQIHAALNNRSYDMRIKGPKIQLNELLD